MRSMVRTLMFLACLLYAAMPGTAAIEMSLPNSKAHAAKMANGHHVMANASEDMGSQSAPCPHGKTMTHTPFCAGCLVLLTDLTFAGKGRSPDAPPTPGLQASLVGDHPAPPLPPPRV